MDRRIRLTTDLAACLCDVCALRINGMTLVGGATSGGGL